MTVARWLETDSLTNQNIASALAIGAYTADADRMVVVDVSLDQVAGNGDYVIYVTRQINGAGSAYVMLPKTTCAAASGETAIAMQSGMISVRSGDVLTVYVDGLAGDTTTPDTVVRWFEMAALQPTAAGRTLDVSAGGEAGIDWGNVGSPTTTVGLSGTTIKASTDTETDIAALPTAVEIVAAIDADPPAVNVTLWKDATAPAMTGDAFARLGAPAGASVSADIAAVKADTAAIRVDTSETLPALLANVGAEVTVVSAVSGGDVTVYANDTWRFTVSDATLALTGYEVLALVVKRTPRQDDSEALLYLRSGAAGLVRINGAAPDNAANGSLASTATSFTGLVAISETAGIAEGKYLWWLKGFDTTPTPNEGLTLAVGTFTVTQPGLQAIA